MKDPLISVLMPAYNHERYVAGAIRSVLAQDWPRIELLVLDDGSTDGTWAVLQELKGECERRCERVSFMRQENRGVCAVMNRLCRQAAGDFVAILASDDEYLPGAFVALARPMLADRSAGVVVGQNEIMDGDGRRCYWDDRRQTFAEDGEGRYATFNAYIEAHRGVRENSAGFGDYAVLLKANHVANGTLIRKSALDAVLPFREEAPLEDFWLHLQLAKLVRYVAVPEHTFRYRWHATNTIRRVERMEQYWWRTLEWEERHVEGLADRRWREAFAGVYWEVRRKFGLGRIFALDSVLTLRERRRVLTVFGREFVLSVRKRNVI